MTKENIAKWLLTPYFYHKKIISSESEFSLEIEDKRTLAIT